MPNHCLNKFIDIESQEKFNEYCVNNTDPTAPFISFEILAPMPSELHIDDMFAAADKHDFDWPDVSLYDSADPFVAACVELGQSENAARRHWNTEHYGFPTWCDWSCQYWGTKWDAYDCNINARSFNTAWASPRGWLKTLAQKMDFVLITVDEDFSCNTGIYRALNGELTYYFLEGGSEEASAFASYVYAGDSTRVNEYLEYATDNQEHIDLLQAAINNFDYNVCNVFKAVGLDFNQYKNR